MNLLDGISHKHEQLMAYVVHLNLHITIWGYENMATKDQDIS